MEYPGLWIAGILLSSLLIITYLEEGDLSKPPRGLKFKKKICKKSEELGMKSFYAECFRNKIHLCNINGVVFDLVVFNNSSTVSDFYIRLNGSFGEHVKSGLVELDMKEAQVYEFLSFLYSVRMNEFSQYEKFSISKNESRVYFEIPTS